MNYKSKFKKTLAVFLMIAMVLVLLPVNGIVNQAAMQQTKKITLNHSSTTLTVGNTIKLKVKTVLPAGVSKGVVWKSSNKKVATVTGKGTVKAVKAGTAVITAVSKNNTKVKATCKIKVYNATKKLQLTSQKNYTLSVGDSIKLEAKVTSPAKNAAPVKWKSSNAKVASIDQNGLVKAISEGSAKMTAVSGKKSVSVNITVQKDEQPAAAIESYTVTFDTGDGNKVAPQTVETGKSAEKPVSPSREGYLFSGWYLDNLYATEYDFSTAVVKDITLYAKWIRIYTVSFNTNGGNEIAAQTVEIGKSVEKPGNPVRNGYIFGGWYSDSTLKKAYNFTETVTQDMTLYAKWNIVNNGNYTGASNIGSGSTNPGNSTGSGSTNPGSSTGSGSTNPGSSIGSGSTNPGGNTGSGSGTGSGNEGSGTGSGSTNPGSGEEPEPTEENCIVTFDTDDGSSLPVQIVKKGTACTQPDIPTKKGYTFEAWYKDSSRTQIYDFTEAVTQNITLYANWEVNAITLSSSKSELSANDTERTVVFRASLNQEDNNITDFKLYRKDTNECFTMKDDGKAASGDDLPNDGIYSVPITLPASVTDYQYYAEADGVEGKSNEISIVVYNELSPNEINEMNNADTQIQELMEEAAYQSVSEDEQIQQVAEMLETLGEQNLIDTDSIYYDKESKNYSFVYSCGVYGMIAMDDGSDEDQPVDSAGELEFGELESAENLPSEQTGTTTEAEQPTADTEIEPLADTEIEPLADTEIEPLADTEDEHIMTPEERDQAAGPQKPDSDGNTYNQKAAKVTILFSRDDPNSSSPYYSKWLNIYNKLNNRDDIDVTINNQVVTAKDYKTAFAGNDLVLVHSHGSRLLLSAGSSLQMYSVVCLRDEATTQKDNEYNEDLKRNRLVKVLSGGKRYYWVCPSFFSYYYNNDNDTNANIKINNAIVYMGMCLGFGDEQESSVDYTLGAELKKAGAASVLGYYNSVYTYYNLEMAASIVDSLLDEKTIGEAVEYAKQTIGNDDEEWAHVQYPGHPAARLILDGSKDKTLFTNAILNGSFEESAEIGDSGWKYNGDARILKRLAELTPTHESNMAIITTGIGSKEAIYKQGTEGSYIYQYFKVPAGVTTISYSYDVVSEEPLEWVGTRYDDRFAAELVDEKGEVLMSLTEETINNNGAPQKWKKIENINFQGGDNTTYHTEWKTETADISAYAGQYVAIRFSVCDLGDSIYDTAALIDHVHLN